MNTLNQQMMNMNDLIFQNRNKTYGAYVLRKAYDGHLLKSVGIANVLFVSSFLILQFLQKLDNNIHSIILACPILSDDITLLPLPPRPPLPPPPRQRLRTLQLYNPPTIAFLPPIVKEEYLVINEILPPAQEEMKEIIITTETKESDCGEKTLFEMPPPPPEAPIEQPIDPVRYEKHFISAQLPQFPTGETDMYKYLAKQLRYPSKARAQDIQGTVLIHFTVDTEGKILNVTVKKGLSSECDAEAMRVVQGMPKWTPARSSGRGVNADFTIPITFHLED
jgi:protein TonB